MPNPRTLLKRRRAIGNMRKITKTMEMVSTAKLARAHQAALAGRPYAAALKALIAELDAAAADFSHPLLAARKEVRRAAVVIMVSDRGLCGSFNSNVIRRARELHADLARRKVETEYLVHGKKGVGAARHQGWKVVKTYLGVSHKPSAARAEEIGVELARRYLAGEIDEVHLVYSSFASRTAQVPTVTRLLPMAAPSSASQAPASAKAAADKTAGHRAWYLFHPDAGRILAELLPLALNNQIFSAMLDNCAGEHAARRLAMKNATDAADEMIGSLTRAYNRARQYKITQEIAEIVGGVEAQG
jgi:F-type H+-transporting ATPase subunit gamma